MSTLQIYVYRELDINNYIQVISITDNPFRFLFNLGDDLYVIKQAIIQEFRMVRLDKGLKIAIENIQIPFAVESTTDVKLFSALTTSKTRIITVVTSATNWDI